MATSEYEEIESRFQRNIKRVKNLLKVYGIVSGPGGGRRSVEQTDVLRAGVVLLHATLEDALRELMKKRMPTLADKVVIDNIPLSGAEKGKRAEKFFLGELIRHKDKAVKQVIADSINEYLEQVSFSDTTEIMTKLKEIKISYDDNKYKLLKNIDALIRRRHDIVHRADASPKLKRGLHRAQAINSTQLGEWIEKVEIFVGEIIKLARS